ncbi:MAG: bifunctional acetate--CoA ligase family protein/GNAT family N-acetyltransferase [Betaproteobacteria bacterium]|nr:bifunctional acetate--CoA ligase family protein/GNAT family N-acetyltransferase [Betaproteobacteria bacterium]
MSNHYLTPLLAPKSVAIIGASEREGALGRFVFENMRRGPFKGALFAVNPRHTLVFGEKCYATLAELPEVPDLIVIATPARTVADLIRGAGVVGVRHAVVLSAGFSEIGDEGRIRSTKVKAELARYGIRMVGPNCLGVIRPSIGLNATFANAPARAGSLALVSQSGAVCTAILDWAASIEIGFSSVISTGGALDLDFGELLDFLVHDVETKSILLYVEGIRDARGFLSALRAASRVKPVVVFKAGRHAAGTQAVTSHTGALAGSDAVFDAALARAGVVRVRSSLQLFAAARILSAAKRPLGPRLAIITNGGGPGVVAADCVTDNELELAKLSVDTIRKLDAVLPPHWSKSNPVDIIGDATPARFSAAADAILDDANVDAVLTLFCPQSITRPEDAAAATINAASRHAKPMFTAWLGGASVQSARALLDSANIANFLTPENAVEAFSYLTRFRKHQAMLLESVSAFSSMSFHEVSQAVAKAKSIREGALKEKRTTLSEAEAKALLAAFRLPVNEGRLAATREEAIAAAKEMGYPVAMKIHSPDITHKSDAGGVRLNLVNGRQLGNAFDDMLEQVSAARPESRILGVNIQPMLKFPNQHEVLVGIKRDVVFGPVIAFGAGGTAVEEINDIALALPPLNPMLGEALIQATRMRSLLDGYRDVPAVDRVALIDILLGASMMACLLPWIEEMDLNPVLTHPLGAAIVDARVVINAKAPLTDLRYRHMAIFPYPIELEHEIRLKDGAALLLRPIRPDDANRERAFVAGLSDESRYSRFQHAISELSAEMIARFTQLDYGREMALVAIDVGSDEIVGVSRYFPNPDHVSVEFAVAIADAWQGRGLGMALMKSLVRCAREAGFEAMQGSVLAGNVGMLRLVDQLGFVAVESDDPNSNNRVALRLVGT